MTTWNYRAFHEDNGDFVIREVYYADDGSIVACTERAVEPYGVSLDELARDLELFTAALSLPVLTLADVPVASSDKPEPEQASLMSHEQLRALLDSDQQGDEPYRYPDGQGTPQRRIAEGK